MVEDQTIGGLVLCGDRDVVSIDRSLFLADILCRRARLCLIQHGNVILLLVFRLYLNVCTDHGKGRGFSGGVVQLHIGFAVRVRRLHSPAHKDLAQCRSVSGVDGHGVAGVRGIRALIVHGAVDHGNGVQLLRHSGDGDIAVRHLDGKRVILGLRVGQPNVIALPAQELLIRSELGVHSDGVARDRLDGVAAASVDEAAHHIQGVDGLVLSGQGDICAGHIEGDLRLRQVDGLTVKGQRGVVFHLPAGELFAFRDIGSHSDFRARNAVLRCRSGAIVHCSGVQVIVHSLQLHRLIRHGEGSGLAAVQRHIARLDIPATELQLLREAFVRGDLDGVACKKLHVVSDRNRHAAAGDRKDGSVLQSKALGFLVHCCQGDIALRHLKGNRAVFLSILCQRVIAFILQFRCAFPVVKQLAGEFVGGNFHLITRENIICAVLGQAHHSAIAIRHGNSARGHVRRLDGDLTLACNGKGRLFLVRLGNFSVAAHNFPLVESLPCAVKVLAFDLYYVTLCSLCRRRSLIVRFGRACASGHSAILYRKRMQRLAHCGQSDLGGRHLKGDAALLLLGFIQHNTGALPAVKAGTCGSIDRCSDLRALVGLVIRHIHGCIGQGNSLRHSGRNVHSICACDDGRNTRVDTRAVLSSRVDVLAGTDDAVCHAAHAIVQDGDRDIARDRNIAYHDGLAIFLTRDLHPIGSIHGHAAVHGGVSSRSNFHLAVTADLNIADDGNMVFARDLDVRCIRDRQAVSYSRFTCTITVQFNVHTRGINGQVTCDHSTELQGIVGLVVAQLICIYTGQDAVYVRFIDQRSIDFDGRKTVLLAEQT